MRPIIRPAAKHATTASGDATEKVEDTAVNGRAAAAGSTETNAVPGKLQVSAVEKRDEMIPPPTESKRILNAGRCCDFL